MRTVLVLGIGLLLASAVTTGVASAQTTQPNTPSTQPGTQGTQYPNVSNVKAFSTESDYMSVAGYLRYLTYQQTGQWLTLDEAKRVVSQQGGQ